MSHITPSPGSEDVAVEAYTGQPSLFSICDVSTTVVEAAKRYTSTGTTISGDEREAARIIQLAALGWSERKIATETHHSRNTIAAVLRLAERSGKIEPVKDRVLACAAAAIHSDIELGDALAEDIRDGKCGELGELASFRRATWVGAGILADKEGPRATSITVNVGGGSVVQVVDDYARRLAAIESESIGTTTESSQSGGKAVVRYIGDTAESSSRPPATVTDLGAIEVVGEGEGGGMRTAEGGGMTDGTT